MDLVLNAAMFTLMFAMGLSLAVDDFRRVATRPRATIVGTLLQLVGMPLVGIATAIALDLPPLLATGLVVVSACPGGMFSNMFVHIGRGHTALSITLTATATLVTLFTLPLWTRFAFVRFSEVGAVPIEMPVLATALRLGLLTVLPVGLGMWARVRRPGWTRYERPLSIGPAIVIVAGSVAQGASRPDFPADVLVEGLIAATVYLAASAVAGVAIPALFGLSARDVATVGVELVVKNILLALVLATPVVPFEALVPIFAFGLLQTPAGIGVIAGWRTLDRRGAFAAEPADPA